MTTKFRNFDWEGIVIGFFIALIISFATFGIALGCYNFGLLNYYDQTFMSNYTEYTLPINIGAYYDALALKYAPMLIGRVYSV